MASDTRERIVEAARELFWQHGFASTSLAQIAERSDARLGSIYYFFKSKTDLLEAVVQHYEEQLGAWLVDPVFERTDDPLERVLGVIDTYRTFLLETRFSLACPVGGLAVELGDEHAHVRERLGDIFASLHATLTECFGSVVGVDPGAPAPEELAALALTIIEGGIVQARALRSIEPFDRSVACLRDYLERLALGAPAG